MSNRKITRRLVRLSPAQMFLRYRHICPVNIGEVSTKARQGRAYKRVPFSSAASFDHEDVRGRVFLCQAASDDGACDATSSNDVIVLDVYLFSHGGGIKFAAKNWEKVEWLANMVRTGSGVGMTITRNRNLLYAQHSL